MNWHQTPMEKDILPLRNCVKKINDACLHAIGMITKEICLSPI